MSRFFAIFVGIFYLILSGLFFLILPGLVMVSVMGCANAESFFLAVCHVFMFAFTALPFLFLISAIVLFVNSGASAADAAKVRWQRVATFAPLIVLMGLFAVVFLPSLLA